MNSPEILGKTAAPLEETHTHFPEESCFAHETVVPATYKLQLIVSPLRSLTNRTGRAPCCVRCALGLRSVSALDQRVTQRVSRISKKG